MAYHRISGTQYCYSMLPTRALESANSPRDQKHAISLFYYYFQSLLEQFVNIRIVVTGDEIRGGEGSLLLLNHRTRMDWLYLWPVMARQAVGLTGIKIVLKSMLKSIPGAGMQES